MGKAGILIKMLVSKKKGVGSEATASTDGAHFSEGILPAKCLKFGPLQQLIN